MFNNNQKRFKRTYLHIGQQNCVFNAKFMEEIQKKYNLPSRNSNRSCSKNKKKNQEIIKKKNVNKPEENIKNKKNSIISKSKKQVQPVKYQEESFKVLSIIINSLEYQNLKNQLIKVRQLQEKQKSELKQHIKETHIQILQKQRSMEDLTKKRNHLIQQANSLDRYYNDVKLQNYDMRCQLQNMRREDGVIYQENYYESLPQIQFDELEYEELLEIGERLGNADIGYPDIAINQMKSSLYKKNFSNEAEQRCCICCCQFEENQQIYKTACKHIHHKACIQKWLKMKKICPLCRQQIVL